MLAQVEQLVNDASNYPEFKSYYQDFVKNIQDNILDNEVNVNRHKLMTSKSLNCVLHELNVLTEELKYYDQFV